MTAIHLRDMARWYQWPMRGIWVVAVLVACGKDAAPPKAKPARDAAVAPIAVTRLPLDRIMVAVDGTWELTTGTTETELRDPTRPGVVVRVTAMRTGSANLVGKELAERDHGGRTVVEQRRREPVTHNGVTLVAAMFTSDDAAGAKRFTTYFAIERGDQVQAVSILGDDLAAYTPIVEQIGKRLAFAITASPTQAAPADPAP
jgi:hypothetical protein